MIRNFKICEKCRKHVTYTEQEFYEETASLDEPPTVGDYFKKNIYLYCCIDINSWDEEVVGLIPKNCNYKLEQDVML